MKSLIHEKKGPSIFEWGLAFVLFMFVFMSFMYNDTVAFLMYEIKFAQAILHGNLREAYEPVVKVLAANGGEYSSLSVYDLPLNLVFGIWGIPLYLCSIRSGTLEITFPSSFWQMLYGKSILLLAFIISTILVYKVCRALDVDDKRSRWASYIYFTSSMAGYALAICGQCDIFAICLVLKGFLEYIRGHNKKFFVYFLIATQFKQFAFFMFVPLMLLADKNLLRAAGRVLLIALTTIICNLPLSMLALKEAFSQRSAFTRMMFYRLVSNYIPLHHKQVSLIIFLLGALCVYCWTYKYDDNADLHEINSHKLFTALASMAILFTSFASYPYWYMHMIPYLAIAAIYNSEHTDKILFFETIGIACVVFFNYGSYDWCYSPNNTVNMLLHNIMGNPELANVRTPLKLSELLSSGLVINSATLATLAIKGFRALRFLLETVYVLCMYSILWLSRPQKFLLGGGHTNIRLYALLRLLINTLVLSFPIIIFFMAIIRR